MVHYYAVLDFECTCWERMDEPDPSRQHEIIEFPVVFVNSTTLETDFEFHEFVRPTENPILSEFCIQLTGIRQSQVDDADDLQTVLKRLDDFLNSNKIDDLTICTDGPWDISKFIGPEATRKGIQIPSWALKWLDVRMKFQHVYRLESRLGLEAMLGHIGLEFAGRPHSGIDDTRNIARIVRAIHVKKGKGVIRKNRRLAID
jgi:3'-5' exoribonuclease 1